MDEIVASYLQMDTLCLGSNTGEDNWPDYHSLASHQTREQMPYLFSKKKETPSCMILTPDIALTVNDYYRTLRSTHSSSETAEKYQSTLV